MLTTSPQQGTVVAFVQGDGDESSCHQQDTTILGKKP